jgi:hypothetical protein
MTSNSTKRDQSAEQIKLACGIHTQVSGENNENVSRVFNVLIPRCVFGSEYSHPV